MSRATRTDVQRSLNLLGFPVGVEDGIFGRGTRGGIQKWQRANGFEATGYLSAQQRDLLLAALGSGAPSAPATGTGGTARQVVATVQATEEEKLIELQQHLKTLGYFEGEANGVSGPEAGRAISNFLFDLDRDPMNSSVGEALALARKAVGVDPAGQGKASRMPVVIALEGRDIIDMTSSSQSEPLNSDKLLIAALQNTPRLRRLEALEALVDRGMLQSVMPYDFPTQNGRGIAQQMEPIIMGLESPSFSKVSFRGRLNPDQVIRERAWKKGGRQGIGDTTALQGPFPVKDMQKYSSFRTVFDFAPRLNVEVPDLPLLNVVSNAEEDATKSQIGQWWPVQHPIKNSAMDIYVHVAVEEFGFDPNTQTLVMKASFEGAEIRTVDDGRVPVQVAYVYPHQSSDLNRPSGVSSHEQLVKVFNSDHNKWNPRKPAESPFNPDGTFNTRFAGFTPGWINLFAHSAAVSYLPEDWKSVDAILLDAAPPLMTRSERAQVLRGMRPETSTLTGVSQTGWWNNHLNTFEKIDAAERLRNEFGDILDQRVFNAPIQMTHAIAAQVGEYDLSTETFPLLLPQRHRLVLFTNPSYASKAEIVIPDGYGLATELPLSRDRARAAYSLMASNGQPTGYFGITFELPAFPKPENMWFGSDQARAAKFEIKVPIVLKRVGFYADEELSELLHEFDIDVAEPESIGGRTAAELFALEPPTHGQIVGAVLQNDTAGAPLLLKGILENTPSYSAVAEDAREAYSALISDRYTSLIPEQGIWTTAVVAMSETDAAARTTRLKFSPDLTRLQQDSGLEANMRVSDWIGNSVGEASGILRIDDELASAYASPFSNFAYEGGLEAVLSRFDNQIVAQPQYQQGNFGLRGYVRIEPRFKEFGRNSGKSDVLIEAEIKEFYLAYEGTDPLLHRILYHEVLGDPAGVSSTAVSATSFPEQQEAMSSDTVVFVLPSGRINEPIGGVVTSCLQQEQVQAVVGETLSMELPFNGAEAGTAYAQFFAAQNAWVTTAGCLQTALEGFDPNANTALSYRRADATSFLPVASLTVQ